MTTTDVLLDYRGHVMFHCRDCGEPITRQDIFEMGMRLPDEGESRDDYMEAELIDEFRHLRCMRAARAG